MPIPPTHLRSAQASARDARHRVRNLLVTAVTASALLSPLLVSSLASAAATPHATAKGPQGTYPSGIVDHWEPSGMAPPGPRALPGYALSYQQEFATKGLPTGWGQFA